jgi:uncharacterized protein
MTSLLAVAQRFDLRTIAPQPWKNGAGTTREIAAEPAGPGTADFDWRLSLAEVDHDAPFSAFPGVDRCIVLLSGAGMALQPEGGSPAHALRPLQPWSFPGERAIEARLAAGPCSDFNVMTRRGRWRADVRVLHDACAIASGHVTFLMSVAGTWQAGAETLQPMQALLWRGLESPMTVAPNANGTAAALLHVRLCHDPFR